MFVNNHDKKKYADINGVRDVLLWYDIILFNRFFANHFQISNRICKLPQSSTTQFLELASGQVEENLGKYVENLETGKTFSWYADDHLHVVDQRFDVFCLTQTKWLETLKTEEQKEKLQQKLARPFFDNFCRNRFSLSEKWWHFICFWRF